MLYNDYGCDTPGAKANQCFKLVSDLKAEGLIDGMGFQMHLSSTQSLAGQADLFKKFTDIGVTIHVTEMDVGGNNNQQQASGFNTVPKNCRANPMCEAFVVWGVSDKDSWRTGENALLFDNNLQKKPQFAACADVIKARDAPAPQPSSSNAPPTSAAPAPSSSAPSSGGAPPITKNGVSSYNWCGKSKWIALTFDDWWPSPAIEDILADLKANNMKASFFLAPGMSSPDANICTKLKTIRILILGSLKFLLLNARRLKNVENVVYSQCGLPAGTMKQFRPPNGDLTKAIALEVNKAGYTAVS
ncbi:hypothetical protein AC1031_015087 [Aphanomyces cochlioides]|nr:hypothetical protein AC1031_015087 [Aphanomyces cochlioides]